EVTLMDLKDIRVQLAGRDSQVEVRLGAQDAGPRLKIALNALDEYKQTPRGSSITYIDMQKDRVVIGSSSGNRLTSELTSNAAPNASEPRTARSNTNAADRRTQTQRGAANDKRQRSEQKPQTPGDSPRTGIGRLR